MTRPDHTEQRLTELEIKVSYNDDLLDTLNDIVVRQQDLIDHLLREVRQLRHQSNEAGGPAPRHLADDLPPHY